MDGSPKKILIVEDDVLHAKLYMGKMARTGYETYLAHNGEEALEKLAEISIDLIILDIMMPGIDGYSFLQKIKADGKCKNIPIVVVSNLGQPEDIAEVKKYGVDEYYIKTDVTVDDILDKIGEIFSQQQ